MPIRVVGVNPDGVVVNETVFADEVTEITATRVQEEQAPPEDGTEPPAGDVLNPIHVVGDN